MFTAQMEMKPQEIYLVDKYSDLDANHRLLQLILVLEKSAANTK